MDQTRSEPAGQIFVCVNVRGEADPLASDCGRAGPAVYEAVKRVVMAAGCVRDVWVTRTLCQGYCPRIGCAVAVEPAHEHYVGVEADDAGALLTRARSVTRGSRTER